MDERRGLLDRVTVDDRVIAARLDRAIAAGEISVHYQPIVDLRRGEHRRLEALSRWPLSSPAVYVRAAERAGTVVGHDLHVLKLVLRDLARWREQGRHERVSVNFSADTMTSPAIATQVARRLECAGVDPADVTIEITETVRVDVERLGRSVLELQSVGVGTSLDDFGTHFSRLGLLSRVPLQELKVDQSFVHDHRLDRTTAVVGSIIVLAHDLGLSVVAEGVESESQANWARTLGCDAVQGHHIHRPVAPDALPR